MDVNHALQTFAIYALPVLFAITLHEAAHGYVARHFGDMTAHAQGRISLNPLRHVDLVGTILVPLVIRRPVRAQRAHVLPQGLGRLEGRQWPALSDLASPVVLLERLRHVPRSLRIGPQVLRRHAAKYIVATAAAPRLNGDGRIDIHVSGVEYLSQHGRHVLYINTGDGRFRDETEKYGLGQSGYGTQALFFDYDGDGDLDAYLLNHATHTERGIGAPSGSIDRDAAADRLMRNDGGRFRDVSEHAGLVRGLDGFGLGVVASDLNGDGCPDLYVANDFQENDLLYVNRCDGTFEERITRATGHTSRFSMGVDAADIDNDGRVDLFVGDMLPEREDVLKTSANAETFNLFNLRLRDSTLRGQASAQTTQEPVYYALTSYVELTKVSERLVASAEAYGGTYVYTGAQTSRRVTADGGKLKLEGPFGPRMLLSIGNHAFVFADDPGTRVVFTMKDGRASGFAVTTGTQTSEATRVKDEIVKR